MKYSMISVLAAVASVNAGYGYAVESSSSAVVSYPASTSTPVGYAVSTSSPVGYVASSSSKVVYPVSSSTPVGYPVHSSKPVEKYTTSTVYETTEYTTLGYKTSTIITKTTVCPVETPKATYPATEKKPEGPYPTGGKPGASYPAGPYPTSSKKPEGPATYPVVKPSSSVPATYPAGPHATYPAGGASTVITKGYTTVKPIPTGAYPVGPKNTTVAFTGAANAQKAGGLLMALGLAAALL